MVRAGAMPFVVLLLGFSGFARAATFVVSNNNDSGAGSLRQAILDSNAAGGSNTISWSGTGGSISNLSPLPTLTASVTFDPRSATSSPIVSGDLNMGAFGATFAGSMEWDGVLSGSGGIVKTSASTALTLTGTNTFSGGISITGSASDVAIQRDGNLGTAGSTVTLALNSNFTVQGSTTILHPIVVDSGVHEFQTATTSVTFAGNISGGELFKGGVGTATVTGIVTMSVGFGVNQGTLVLTATNSLAGFVSIAQGSVLAVNGDANLNTPALLNQGGTFRVLSSTTIATAYTTGYSGQTGFFDTNGNSVVFVGSLSSTYTFVKIGGGLLTVTGDHGSFTGGFESDAGFIASASSSALGSGSLSLNGGGYSFSSTNSLTNSVVLLANGGTMDTAGAAAVVGSSVSGSGVLTVIGTGTLSLQGSNSYSGGTVLQSGYLLAASTGSLGTGTVTFQGGGLRTTAAISGFDRSVSFGVAGGTIDTNGFDSTIAAAIGGSGTLYKIGGGTLSLTGSDSHTGGTSVAAGVLRANSNSLAGAVSNGAVLTFDQGFDGSFVGNISGVGSFVKSGTGTLTLSGINSYSGGTLVNAGVLQGNTLSIQGGVTNNSSVAFNQSFNSTYSGAMTGVGSLIKLGTGTLSLSGTNTFSGGTTVSAGTLRLGVPSALLDGSNLAVASGGVFDLNSYSKTLGQVATDGTVQLGTGRLTAASLSGAGTLATTLSGAASFGSVSVGTAAIGAMSLQVQLSNYVPPSGSSFTVLVATSLTGRFASIYQPAAMQFSASYYASSVAITAQAIPYANSASDQNQLAVARIVEAYRASTPGDWANVLAQLDGLSAPALQSALKQMGPAGYAALQSLSGPSNEAHVNAVGDRLARVRTMSGNDGAFTYSRVHGAQWYPGITLADPPGDIESIGLSDSKHWGFFGSALGSLGRQDGKDGAPGYSFGAEGVTIGVDRSLSERVLFGVALGYVRSNSTVDDGGGTTSGDSVKYGVYAQALDGDWHADGYLGGGSDFFNAHRSVQILARTADSHPQGQDLSLKIGGGYDLSVDRAVWTPSFALLYDDRRIASFQESGAGALDLSVAPQINDSFRSQLGMAARIHGRRVRPYASAVWEHEWRSTNASINSQFADGATPTFSVRAASPSSDAAIVGAGIESDLARNLAGKVGYSGEFRSGYASHSLVGTLRLTF